MSARESESETMTLGSGPARTNSRSAGPGGTGPLAAGEPFGPRYRILRELGAGGMGVVYQAWDEELGVPVALKVIRTEVTSDPYLARDVERRFKRELLLARQVTHSNVVRIYDLGEIDGIKYITMLYVEGVDLATVIQREGRLPTRRALRMVRGVVSGLRAAHEAGVVHRDLKPANIMIDEQEEARIMDFGIARSTSLPPDAHAAPGDGEAKLFELRQQAAFLTGTMQGGVVGTIEYMAPEQARGQEVDQRADIYAFGLIMYDMLGGAGRAARSDSALVELTARMDQPPPAIRSVNPEVPEALARVISRCVQPDANARYATTRDLDADLQRLDDDGNLLPVLRRVSTRQLLGAGVLTLSLVAGTWWFARPPAVEVQPPPTSVLIADFENRAGDPVFEGSVEQALAISLEGASFITVYPRRQAQQVATQLGSGGHVTAESARLISRREGIKVVVGGTVEKQGSGYRVTATALDPARDPAAGVALATASATASGKAEVLRAVSAVGAKLRAELGDKKPESERLAAAETFTAASLGAMRAYVRAQELTLANRNKEALQAYQQAIDLDPEFGRAYTGMAVIYSNFKDHANAEHYYQEAMKRAERMTEREKLRTFGSYYLLGVRNYEQAIQEYEELVKKYPADDGGHGNLALARLNTGDVHGAVTEVKASLNIYPSNSLQRYNYAIYSMYAGDFDTAISETSRLMKENAAFEYPYVPYALSTLSKGDTAGARKAYGALENLSPLGFSMAKLGDADLEMYLGRYREARTALEQGIARDVADNNNANLAQKYVALAEVHLALGDRRSAVEAARRAVKLSRVESILYPSARVLIEAHEPTDAAAIARDLENMLQRQTVAYASLISGEIALANGRPAAAIEAFRDGQKRHDSWFSRFLLGRTYAEAGRYAEALGELELALKRRGEVGDVFFYDMPTLRYLPPLYYWLGRAQDGLGAKSVAAEHYRKYLEIRSGAEKDVLGADAKKRLPR
jgi:serine/threonine protein kinase/tetratricopeptide (TPR) repeat protein